MLGTAALPSPASAKRVALVIGIDQYDNLPSEQQLKKAVGDAHAVGEAFRSLGYDVQEADNVARLDFLRQWQRFLNRIERATRPRCFSRAMAWKSADSISSFPPTCLGWLPARRRS
jgi:hypothetical protein